MSGNIVSHWVDLRQAMRTSPSYVRAHSASSAAAAGCCLQGMTPFPTTSDTDLRSMMSPTDVRCDFACQRDRETVLSEQIHMHKSQQAWVVLRGLAI